MTQNTSGLHRVAELCRLFLEQKEFMAEAKGNFEKAEKTFKQTERETLPDLMKEVGVKELTLDDGAKVNTKLDCVCGISEANHHAAMTWLKDNDHGGLIKTVVTVTFGRGDDEEAQGLADLLISGQLPDPYLVIEDEYSLPGNGYGESVEMRETVHHSTLKAFVLDQLKKGNQFPMDLFGVIPFDKAAVKVKK